MPDYSHLQSRTAESRYALAAHYLGQCRHIVEVGGHRICDFLHDLTQRKFWNIDPTAEQEHWESVKTYAIPVSAFNFNLVLSRASRNGLCLLGLEMYDETYGVGSGMESTEHLAKSLHFFDTVVMDFVPENPVANMQSLVLLGAADAVGFTRTVAIDVSWQPPHPKYQIPNESFSKPRNFWVMEKK